MMSPVVRVISERAATARHTLLSLAEAVPEPLWRRTDGTWTGYQHFAHALTADALLLPVLAEAADPPAGAAIALGVFERQRLQLLATAESLAFAELADQAFHDRGRVLAALNRLEAGATEAPLSITGADGVVLAQLSLLDYLSEWSRHDGEHERQIRALLSSNFDLSALALRSRRS
jgi:hypothetical protein